MRIDSRLPHRRDHKEKLQKDPTPILSLRRLIQIIQTEKEIKE
jgi:hypothetical protein